MTAAVAGAAARSAGARSAGTAAARSTATRRPTRAGNAPRPNVDEREAAAAQRTRDRSDQAAGKFRADYAAGRKSEKKAPKPEGSAVSTGEAPSVNVNLPGSVSSGAGAVLAFVFWTWIALPFLKDGPTGVKNMLKAKFTNKRADGSYLP